MMRLRSCGAMAAVLVASALAGTDAEAQAVSLQGGARIYEDGAMAMVALRTEFPLPGPVLLELSGSVADPRDDAERSAAGVLEGQLQAEVPLGLTITPYFGAGAGVGRTYTFGDADDGVELMYSLGAGARVAFSEQLGLIVDARMRGIRDADDIHTDVSVGVRYQFRPTDRPRFHGARP